MHTSVQTQKEYSKDATTDATAIRRTFTGRAAATAHHTDATRLLVEGRLEIDNLLPNNQRQHRTLNIQKNAALRIMLVTAPHVSRSCEHFPDGFDFHLRRRTARRRTASRRTSSSRSSPGDMTVRLRVSRPRTRGGVRAHGRRASARARWAPPTPGLPRASARGQKRQFHPDEYSSFIRFPIGNWSHSVRNEANGSNAWGGIALMMKTHRD